MSMTIGQALIYSVLGIAVVFFALVLLMLICKLILAATKEKTAKAEAPVETPAEPVAAATAPGTAGDVKLYDTDPRDAAMVMAIVADQLQKPLNELRFISIKEVKEG